MTHSTSTFLASLPRHSVILLSIASHVACGGEPPKPTNPTPPAVVSGDSQGSGGAGDVVGSGGNGGADQTNTGGSDTGAGGSASGDTVCQESETLCESKGEEICVDTKTDASHCGACGVACTEGAECSAGECVLPFSCENELLACNGECIDPNTDRTHCGASADCEGTNVGTICDSSEDCVQGACVDPRDWTKFAQVVADFVGGFQNKPQVVMTPSGQAVAVWSDAPNFINPTKEIRASHFDGSSWSQPERISQAGKGDANDPQVVANDKGDVIAVWRQFDSGRVKLMANRLIGKSWSTAEVIDTSAGNVFEAHATMDAAGKAHVVWSENDRIMTSRFDGSAWSIDEPIKIKQGAAAPRVASSASGAALSLWVNVNKGVFASQFDGIKWGPAQLISGIQPNAKSPELMMNDNGEAAAVWVHENSIFAADFDGSTWSLNGAIESSNDNAEDPQVAMGPNGTAIAVWEQSDHILSNRFDGTSWGTAETIDLAGNTPFLSTPRITLDAQGKGLAVWVQDKSIVANRFNGQGWAFPKTISALETPTAPSDNVTTPHLAMTASGEAHAVWTKIKGFGVQIESNAFGSVN